MLWSIIWVLGSCKPEKTPIEPSTIVEIPEDFVKFYKRFHEDSLYQIAHIHFPLEGRRPDSTEVLVWSADDWIFHRAFNDLGIFERELQYFNGIIIENIKDRSGEYNMERRWVKRGSEWIMIYYRDMGQD